MMIVIVDDTVVRGDGENDPCIPMPTHNIAVLASYCVYNTVLADFCESRGGRGLARLGHQDRVRGRVRRARDGRSSGSVNSVVGDAVLTWLFFVLAATAFATFACFWC